MAGVEGRVALVTGAGRGAGVRDVHRERDSLASTGLHAAGTKVLEGKRRVAQPEPELELGRVAVPIDEAVAVEVVVRDLERRIVERGKLIETRGKGQRELAGGVGCAEQEVRDRAAELEAAQERLTQWGS